MTERIINQWNADPGGEMVVKVYEVSGIKAVLRGLFQPTRTFDAPSGVCAHLYEPSPITLKANQRVEVIQGEKVVMTG
jgi:hypothetical protein